VTDPDNLLLARWGTLLPAGMVVARDGVEIRMRLLVLLVTAAVALAPVAPELEFESIAACVVQRARAAVWLIRLASTIGPVQSANVVAPLATSSRSTSHPGIIELTCSRLC